MDSDTNIGTLNAEPDTTVDSTVPATEIFDTAPNDTAETVETPASDTIRLSDGTEVTLDELERGYLRQSDYTRKTQDVARQREELEQAQQLMAALEADPVSTIEALQRHLLPDAVDEDLSLDPLEMEVRQQREWIEQQQAAQIQREVEAELNALASQYGEFDANGVLSFAVEREIPDLEAALLLYTKQQERDAQRKAANEEALARKRGAPPVAGGSRAQGTVSDNVQVDSVLDAWRAAKRELGYE